MGALFEVMLPVFLVTGVGFILARLFTIDQLSLNKVQLYALTPALGYSSLMNTAVSPAQVGQLAAGYVVATVAAGLLMWVVTKLLGVRPPGALVATVMLGNNGNFGLPIALLALGQAGLDQALVIFVLAIIMLWTIGPALFGQTPTLRGVLSNIARLPVIWSILLALVFRLVEFVPPPGVTTAIDMISAASIPLILIALGLQLGSAKRLDLSRNVVVVVLLRLLVVPMLAWGIGLLLGLRGLELQSLVLALSMPSAVNVFLLALEYDRDAEQVANIVALSTVLSFATISILVANLQVFT